MATPTAAAPSAGRDDDGPRVWSLADLGSDPDMPGPSSRRPPRRRRRRGRLLLVLAVSLLLLVSVPLVVGVYLEHRLTSHLGRIDGVFAGLPDRPARPAPGTPGAGAVNILVLGTDRVADAATTGTGSREPMWVPGAQRSDTMMLIHIDGSRQVAAVVSIPRDSWVTIPGHGRGKINWAYSYGGPRLAVQTVEQLTGLRLDHLAVVDWTGFMSLTDHVGGVDVDVPETVHDPHNDVTWTAGRHHLDGEEALLYVRQRYGLPGGDFDRMRRQQAVLRAVLQASMQQEMRKDPRLLYGFLERLASGVSVDSDWSVLDMARLALSLRDFRSGNLRFLTAPTLGTGRVGSQSVVRLDPRGGAELWSDLRSDRIDQWSALHWDQLTAAVVR